MFEFKYIYKYIYLNIYKIIFLNFSSLGCYNLRIIYNISKVIDIATYMKKKIDSGSIEESVTKNLTRQKRNTIRKSIKLAVQRDKGDQYVKRRSNSTE